MRTRKAFVATTLVLSLLFTLAAPSRVRALDTATIAIAAGCAVVVWGVVAYVGAKMTKSHPYQDVFLQELPHGPAAASRSSRDTLRFGAHCRPDSGNLTLVCW